MKIPTCLASFLLFSLLLTDVQTMIPFCSWCECTFESHGAANLDCTNTDMNDILYDPYFWIDEFNSSYNIASMRARNGNLQDIAEELQSSTLRRLDLRGNSIGEIADGAFGSLQNMEELDLGNNSIEQLGPDVFKGMYLEDEYYPLKAMRVLRLDNNKIKHLDAKIFVHMKKIEELYLGNNPFENIDLDTAKALASLGFLKKLDLSGTQLETVPSVVMSSKLLQFLDLSNNHFMKIPSALQNGTSLEVLNFSLNPITDITEEDKFPEMSNLHTLYLNYMPNLETIGPRSLGGLKHLISLHLNDNYFLRQIHAKAFNTDIEVYKELPNLQHLDISSNNLTHLDMSFLPHWDALETISVSSNPWYCDCYNEIFIREVVTISAEEAKHVKCFQPSLMKDVSFFDIDAYDVQLPCSVIGPLNKFGLVLFMVAFCNSLIVATYCCCRRRCRRTNIYVTLRNV